MLKQTGIVEVTVFPETKQCGNVQMEHIALDRNAMWGCEAPIMVMLVWLLCSIRKYVKSYGILYRHERFFNG